MTGISAVNRLAPAIRPPGRPAGFQRWRHLLFLHWEVDPAALRASLPESLEVDHYEGKAYIGVVPFTMRDVVPWWSPPVPGISHFHELNVRTYVVHNGVPGVWFYSLEAAASLAVLIARTGWSLPYHRASMQLERVDDAIHYRSRRLWPGPKPARFEANYRILPSSTEQIAQAGTLDHFFVERYVLYCLNRRGQLQSGYVHHRPYPLRQVELQHVDDGMIAAAGFEQPQGPPIVHYSPGVDVDIYRLQRV